MPFTFTSCLPAQKPDVSLVPVANFGVPAGTNGRNGYAPEIVVIHCVSESLAQMDELACRSFKKRNTNMPRHFSPHFMVGNNGAIHQYVDPADAAWGFPELIHQNVPNLSGINWPIINSRPGVQPDLYALHIFMEGGASFLPDDDCVNRCPGECGTPLCKTGADSLAHLLKWINETYGIALDSDHVKFHQDADAIAEDECPCHSIDALLACANAYCESCDNPDHSLWTESDLIAIYGVNEYGCKAKQGVDELICEALARMVPVAPAVPDSGVGGETLFVNPANCEATLLPEYSLGWNAATNSVVLEENGAPIDEQHIPTLCEMIAAATVGAQLVGGDGVVGADCEKHALPEYQHSITGPTGGVFELHLIENGAIIDTDPFDITAALLGDLCRFGAGVPAGALTDLVGRDANGCLIHGQLRVNAPLTGNGTTTPLDIDMCAALGDFPASAAPLVGGNVVVTASCERRPLPSYQHSITGPAAGVFNLHLLENGAIIDTDPLDVTAALLGDLCRFGQNIPAGVATTFLARDASGCVIHDVIRTDNTLSGNGTAASPLHGTIVTNPTAGVYVVDHAVLPDVTIRLLSGDADNVLTLGSDGGLWLSCEGIQDCVGAAIAQGLGLTYNDAMNSISAWLSGIAVTDTDTVDLTLSPAAPTANISATVRIAPVAGQAITVIAGSGLYVPDLCTALAARPVGLPIGAGQSIAVLASDCTVRTLTIPPAFDLCAAIAARPAGAAIGQGQSIEVLASDCSRRTINVPADVPLVANDSATIDFSVSGVLNHILTGAVRVSAAANNSITVNGDGLYVPNICAQIFAMSGGAAIGAGQAITLIAADCTRRTVTLPAAPGDNTIAVSPDNGGGALTLLGSGGAATGNIQNGVLIDTGDAPACTTPAGVRGTDGRSYSTNVLMNKQFSQAFPPNAVTFVNLPDPAPGGTAGAPVVVQSLAFNIPCNRIVSISLQELTDFLGSAAATWDSTHGLVRWEYQIDGGAWVEWDLQQNDSGASDLAAIAPPQQYTRNGAQGNARTFGVALLAGGHTINVRAALTKIEASSDIVARAWAGIYAEWIA